MAGNVILEVGKFASSALLISTPLLEIQAAQDYPRHRREKGISLFPKPD